MLSKFHKLMIIGGATASLSIAAFVGAYTAGQVAWFDPNDLTTMWQDNKGQTPAAVGSPVGLFVEKSQGLTLTRVSSWPFDDATGLTLAAGITVGGGTLNFAAASTTCTTNFIPTAGKLYRITYTISNYSGTGTLAVQLGGIAAAFRTANGTYVDYLPLTSTVTSLRFPAASSLTCSLDNVFVEEVACAGVITASGTVRPILRQAANGFLYLEFDGVDDTLIGSTASLLYGPMVSTHYLTHCLSKSGSGTNYTFAIQNTNTVYHRITGVTTAQRLAAGYRTIVGGAFTVATATNAVPDNTVVVADSQILPGSMDIGVNGTLVTAAMTSDTVGLCFFVIGSSATPMNFYGGLSVLAAVNSSDRAGLQKAFGALGGLSL